MHRLRIPGWQTADTGNKQLSHTCSWQEAVPSIKWQWLAANKGHQVYSQVDLAKYSDGAVVNIQFELYIQYNGMYPIPKLVYETIGPFYTSLMTQLSF